jgi:Tfp pilus assembly protein PilZ
MGDAPKIAVALDATGPSNFYHGPGGADVARHGGIFVATDAAWTVGSPVQMVVTVRGGPPFDIMGVVRWTRPRAPNAPAGFGASFLEVGERAEQEIAAFVRSRPPFFYGT